MTPPPNYRRAFWSSRHHLWLAVLTLGLGFASGEPLGLLIGTVAYALGWIFVPDFAFFRRAIDAQAAAAAESTAAEQRESFRQEQERLLGGLSRVRRERHEQLVAVCRDVEAATGTGTSDFGVESRRGKLDELVWTYLRMLAVEQSLEVYLETERKEQIPAAVRVLEEETQTLAAEVESLRAMKPVPAVLAGKQRLLTSRLERLEALNQRLRRIEQAQTNHELVRSEQARLVEQVKLIRADAIAAKNTDTLTARIDLSIEHLASTNKWLSELAEFKDLTTQIPAGAGSPASAAHPSVSSGRSVSQPTAEQ